ncbi:MAG: rhomboid family intramembrane serine protease [Halorhabdus sp.]
MVGTPDRVTRLVRSCWHHRGYVPVTIGVIAGLSWLFLASGITDADVTFSLTTALNPLWYVQSMVIHDDWAHFYGNMELLVPFGLVLTWLTSNRHVLGVVLGAQFAAAVLSFAVRFGPGVGSSLAVFAVVAAALVKAVGDGFQRASAESLQTMLLTLVGPLALGLFLVAVIAGGHTRVDHFGHFFAFLFGGAIETMFVLAEHGKETERSVPDRIVH